MILNFKRITFLPSISNLVKTVKTSNCNEHNTSYFPDKFNSFVFVKNILNKNNHENV